MNQEIEDCIKEVYDEKTEPFVLFINEKTEVIFTGTQNECFLFAKSRKLDIFGITRKKLNDLLIKQENEKT